jgi:hypothetical protein
MKTYTILFAEDVPHYGTVQIEARNKTSAIKAAEAYDYSDVATDPTWENSICKRIVYIVEEPDCTNVAEDIPLDNCFVRYGGDKERVLCDAAPEMLIALQIAEKQLAMYCAGDDRRDAEAWQALEKVRAAIAQAKGRAP